MKKRTVRIICALLCLALTLGASSCTFIDNIKENARREAEKTFEPSPEDAALTENFNAALERSLAEAEKVTEKTSLTIGKPTAESENGDVSALNAAANTLKKLLTQDDPGSGERELAPDACGDTLLKSVTAADVLKTVGARNEAEQAVTDEKGAEVADENGKVVTEKTVTDNILKTEFRFYTVIPAPDAPEDDPEQGGTPVPASAEIMEKYFGEPRDSARLLAQFEGLKDYLQISGYTLEYKDCRIAAQTDLAAGRLTEVSYVRSFAVTVTAKGVGALAGLGDFTLTFDAAETVAYIFAYPAA